MLRKYLKDHPLDSGKDLSKLGSLAEGPQEDASSLQIVLGAGRTQYTGWLSTERGVLDITRDADFHRLLGSRLAVRFLAEHVWEHLSDDALIAANALAFKYLQQGGCLRIAVPDGLHPDPGYIERVKPGGTGPAADDHKRLFTHATLAACLEASGFVVDKLEFWDEAGDFHRKPWNSQDGHVKRSAQHDRRTRKGHLAYTSLIVDAHKPQ
jgi:predicted SAM-dependent methyltransferase